MQEISGVSDNKHYNEINYRLDSVMPIHLGWYVEQHVILQQPIGIVTEAEMFSARNQALEMLDAAHPSGVSVLIDCTQLREMPGLPSFRKMRWYGDSRLRLTVAWGLRNRLYVFIARTTSRLHRARLHICDDAVTALAVVQADNPSLPNLKRASAYSLLHHNTATHSS